MKPGDYVQLSNDCNMHAGELVIVTRVDTDGEGFDWKIPETRGYSPIKFASRKIGRFVSKEVTEKELFGHTLSLNEREHQERARRLRAVFTGKDPVDELANFLHQQYRATAKALVKLHGHTWRRHDKKVVIDETSSTGPLGPLLHDHGWGDCYGKKKRYFLRRALWLMTDYPAQNGGRRRS